MAKYIKTEEGYKPLNEIEGGSSLIADKYLEIKNNTIRTTLGDPIVNEEGTEILNTKIPSMSLNASFGDKYTTDTLYGMANLRFPNGGDIYEVEVQYSNGQIVVFDNVEYKRSSDYIGNFECSDDIRILLTNRDPSYPEFGIVILISSTNLSGGKLKILRKTGGYVTLPKTALEYDKAPTEYSVNLLTSGTVYTVIQNLQGQIDRLKERLDEEAQAMMETE